MIVAGKRSLARLLGLAFVTALPLPLLGCTAAAENPAPPGVKISTQVGEVVFRDSPGCDEALCLRHTPGAIIAGRYVVVKVEGTDGNFAYLVDRTSGEVRQLNAAPIPNPSGTAFVTASFDEMNDTPDTGGVFVWSFDDAGRPVVQRHLRLDEFAVEKVIGWSGDRCVTVEGFRGWGTGRHTQPVRASMRLEGTSWRLLPAPCETSEGN